MAVQSRRDQVAAYRFLLRRRHAALLAGDPDSAEAPLRKLGTATFAGVMTAVLMAAGAGVAGLLSPGHSTSWKAKGVIIVEKGTGTRFIYDRSAEPPVLRHVLNYTSARLLLTETGWQTVSVSAKSLAGTPRGADVGIVGAPDELPGGGVTGQAWTACSIPGAARTDRPVTQLAIGMPPPSLPPTTALSDSQGLLVQDPAGSSWLVWHGRRFHVGDVKSARPADAPDRVLSVLGFVTGNPARVGEAWLDTLPESPPLLAPTVDTGATTGLTAQGRQLASGQLVRVPASPGVPETWYVATPQGFAPVDNLQRQLLEGDSQLNRTIQDATPGDVAVSPLAPAGTVSSGDGHWPNTPPALVNAATSAQLAVCATVRAASPDDVAVSAAAMPLAPGDSAGSSQPPQEAGRFVADDVQLPPGSAALVRGRAHPGAAGGTAYLVSGNGRFVTKDALSAPDLAAEIKALGYAGAVPTPVADSFLALIPDGPALSPAAAGQAFAPPAPSASPSSSGVTGG